MFTTKDIELKTVYVINCIDKRNLRVSNGELLLEESDTSKTLTKLPFQKILAIIIKSIYNFSNSFFFPSISSAITNASI